MFDFKYPNTNKPHRCPECHAVMYEGEGIAGAMPRFYRQRVQHCYRCGAKVLPLWVKYGSKDEWKRVARRAETKATDAVHVVKEVQSMDDAREAFRVWKMGKRLSLGLTRQRFADNFLPRTYLAVVLPNKESHIFLGEVTVLGVAHSEAFGKELCETHAFYHRDEKHVSWEDGEGRIEGSDEVYRILFAPEGALF